MSITDHLDKRGIPHLTLSIGETEPYRYCVYLHNIPIKRTIGLNEALDYMRDYIRNLP